MKISQTAISAWCERQFPEHLALLKTVAAIPAPSHHEDLRAEFIKNWLLDNGADTVIIDDAKNVILPLGDTNNPVMAVMAHTDVVFPDTGSLPVREENGKLFAPGVGDDTANVAALMFCAKFLLTHPELLPEPVLIIFNACEEGLGNLKGVRQIMSDYAGRIRSLVSFDCQSDSIVSRAVGSERWQVSVHTKGGHSFSDFGNTNAISLLSELVVKLYRQEVPAKEGCTTTYNAGLISGGTSVNTIAQNAELTYEYRSDDRECLQIMKDQFFRLVSTLDSPDSSITVTSLGIRPCGGDIPQEEHNDLLNRCRFAIQTVYDQEIPLCAASTDANIPLSLGIPAATFGLYRGGGAHTREEYVEISSLTPGLRIALTFFLHPIFKNGNIDRTDCP